MSTETQKLYRSRDNRMIGGVCGGLGEFFDIDPTLIRLLFVLLTIFGGSGVLVYLVMLLIVPEEPLEGTSSPPVQEQVEPESSTEESEFED
jgi:phage shock protein PspC (stress-responsive transcriptional regulator)